MNVCIDIGNSYTQIGFFRNNKMRGHGSLESGKFPKYLQKLVKSGRLRSKNVVISSVSPKNLSKVKQILAKNGGSKPKIISISGLSGIKYRYKDPKKLGLDRAINAYGAFYLLKGDCLVADFGTALTIDFVSRRGVFEGGRILPGLEPALASLSEKTALLPKVGLKGPAPLPGTSTETCMRGGIVKGYAAMLAGLREEFKKKYRLKSCEIVITGGHTEAITPHLKGVKGVIIDPQFTLRSLNFYLATHSR